MKTLISNQKAKDQVSVKMQINGGNIYDGTIERMGKKKGIFTGAVCHPSGIVFAPARKQKFEFNVSDVTFFNL